MLSQEAPHLPNSNYGFPLCTPVYCSRHAAMLHDSCMSRLDLRADDSHSGIAFATMPKTPESLASKFCLWLLLGRHYPSSDMAKMLAD